MKQSYSNLEIILVDDGSTDSSGNICNYYSSQDSRIKVIHKTNGGLSDARNAGLDICTGDYITFIDADDYVHPYFAQILLNAAISNEAQIAACTWQELNNDDQPKAVEITPSSVKTTIFNQDQALANIFYQKKLNHSACSRIFQASLFKDLRFPRGVLYEDLAIIYPLICRTTTVALVEAPMYYYMHREGSIINTMTIERTHVLDHLDKIEKLVSEEKPHLLPAVQSRKLSACFNMLRLMPAKDPQWQQTKQRCWDYVKNIRNVCITDKNVRLKNKLAIILSYFGLDFLMLTINQNK